MASTPPLPLSQAHHFISIKLTSKNFVHWKTQLVPFLEAHNLLRFLDGSFPRPQDTSSNSPTDTQDSSSLPDGVSHWDRQDALLRSLLISSLTEEVLPLVVGLSTSKDIWDSLHRSFASTSTSRILSLRLAMQDLVHKPDEAVSAFLQRAKAISDELAAAGHPLHLADFNLHVFRALRSNFREVLPVLMGSPEPLLFDDLHARLASHEFLLQSHLKKQLTPTASCRCLPLLRLPLRLLLAPPVGAPSSVWPRPWSWWSRWPWPTSAWPSLVPHLPSFQSYRRHLLLAPAHPRLSTSVSSPFPPSSSSYAYCLVTAPTCPSYSLHPSTCSGWHLVSRHRCNSSRNPYLQDLSAYTPYGGSEQVTVGNGQGLNIAHTGSTSLLAMSSSLLLRDVLHVPSITKSLLSVHRFTADNNVFFEFHSDRFHVKDSTTRRTLLTGRGVSTGCHHCFHLRLPSMLLLAPPPPSGIAAWVIHMHLFFAGSSISSGCPAPPPPPHPFVMPVPWGRLVVCLCPRPPPSPLPLWT